MLLRATRCSAREPGCCPLARAQNQGCAAASPLQSLLTQSPPLAGRAAQGGARAAA